MSELWEPERLSTVGWIMNRYSDFLIPGDLVRIGQEGDPCSTYRSSDDAPSARVENVEREVDGTIRFRAVIQGSGAVVNLDNRNVASDRIWEIHPSQVEEFRERVQRDRTHRGSDYDRHELNDEANEQKGEYSEEVASVSSDKDDSLRETFDTGGLDHRVREMEFRGTEIEKTFAGAIRELAEDMLRIYRGERPNFSIRFADKYDLALHTDVPVSYKGSRNTEMNDIPHSDRHDFDIDTAVNEANNVSTSLSSRDRHAHSIKEYSDNVESLVSYDHAYESVVPVTTLDEP